MTLRLKIILIFLALLGGLYLAFVLMADRLVAPTISNNPVSNGTDPITGEEQTVVITRSYANGTHTLRGVIALPTPCHTFSQEVRVMESYPEQVVIDFTSKDSGAICVQIIDERPFEVTFQASEAATIRATLNGNPLILSVKNS